MNSATGKSGALLAGVFAAMTVGITFRIALVTYGLYILLLAFALLVHDVRTTLLSDNMNTLNPGVAGVMLLAVFVGVQLPFAVSYAWLGMIIFTVIAVYGEVRGGQHAAE